MTFYRLPLLSDGQLELWLSCCAPMVDKAWAPSYQFFIFPAGTLRKDGSLPCADPESAGPLGHIHLRLGMNDNIYYGGHIGYGGRERARGHGIAARACRIVAPLARAHDMEELIITTTPDNVASIKTIEHLGASFEGNVGVPRYHDLYRRGDKVVSRYVWNISGVPPLTGLTPLVPTDWSDAVEQPFRGIF